MEKEKQFEQIEAYLKGTLTGKEKTAFEQKIKKDASLAEEVNIQKDMAKTLASSPKDDFRNTLIEANQEFSARSNNIKAGAWVSLGILLVLLSSLVFFFYQHDNTEHPQTIDEEVQNVIPPPPSVQENRPVMPSEEKGTINQPNNQALRDIPQEEKKELNPATEPIALDFRSNRALEDFINNPSRSSSLTIQIYQPFENSTALLKDGKINFAIDGVIKLEEGSTTPPIQLLVFSNKPSDYENFNALYKERLTLTEIEGELKISIAEQMEFTPGLYYLYFENLNSGEVYAVRKFRVKSRLD